MGDINFNILRILLDKKKPIILITILAGTLAFITTLPFIIKPKYRSVAYVYPANMVPFFMDQGPRSFSHTELLMQFLSSNDIKTDVMKELDLPKHYGLDTTNPKFQTYFNDMFEDNIKFSLTRFESAELSILDRNPDTAQLIASSIIKSVNKLLLNQHEQKFKEFIGINKIYLDAHKKSLDSLKSLMAELGKKYGIIDIESQSKEISRNYYKLMAESKENAKLNDVMQTMKEHASEFILLNEVIQTKAKEYAKAEDDYYQSIRDYNRKVSYTVTASTPTKPVEKYWPKRGIIIIISMLSAFLFSSFYFIYASKLQYVSKD